MLFMKSKPSKESKSDCSLDCNIASCFRSTENQFRSLFAEYSIRRSSTPINLFRTLALLSSLVSLLQIPQILILFSTTKLPLVEDIQHLLPSIDRDKMFLMHHSIRELTEEAQALIPYAFLVFNNVIELFLYL